MSDFYIERLVPEDLPEIIALCIEHAAHEKANYDPVGKLEKLRPYIFGPQPSVFILVLKDKLGKIHGYATYTIEFSTWDAAHYFHVDCLYIRESARNKGIGWIFGKRIAQEMIDLNMPSMQFQTPPFNTAAIRIYQAMGATPKEKIRFYATQQDARRFVDRQYRAKNKTAKPPCVLPREDETRIAESQIN